MAEEGYMRGYAAEKEGGVKRFFHGKRYDISL